MLFTSVCRLLAFIYGFVFTTGGAIEHRWMIMSVGIVLLAWSIIISLFEIVGEIVAPSSGIR